MCIPWKELAVLVAIIGATLAFTSRDERDYRDESIDDFVYSDIDSCLTVDQYKNLSNIKAMSLKENINTFSKDVTYAMKNLSDHLIDASTIMNKNLEKSIKINQQTTTKIDGLATKMDVDDFKQSLVNLKLKATNDAREILESLSKIATKQDLKSSIASVNERLTVLLSKVTGLATKNDVETMKKSLATKNEVDTIKSMLGGLTKPLKDQQGQECPSPFFKLQDQCFYINRHESLTWSASRKSCQAMGPNIDLAQPIYPQNLRIYIWKTFGDYSNKYQLGGSDLEKEGDWRWNTGGTLSGERITKSTR